MFKIATKDLKAAIKQCKKLVTKTGMAEQANIVKLFGNEEKQEVTFRACMPNKDFDITLEYTIPIVTTSEIGSATFDLRLMDKYIKTIGKENVVSLEIDEDSSLFFIDGDSSFRLGKITRFFQPDTASLECGQGFQRQHTITAENLYKCLTNVEKMTATDDLRYFLYGTNIERTDDEMSFTATDGHRLIRLSVAETEKTKEGSAHDSFLLSNDAIRILRSLTDEKKIEPVVSYTMINDTVFLRCGNWLVKAQSTPVTYPDYRQLVSSKKPIESLVSSLGLSKAMSRVMITRDDNYFILEHTKGDDHWQISATTGLDNKSAFKYKMRSVFKEEIIVEKIVAKYDAEYWKDAVDSMPNDCDFTFRFVNNESPIWFDVTEEGIRYLYAIMPIRMDDKEVCEHLDR